MNPSQLIGKSTEMLVSSMLLDKGRELYPPAIDDHGVDMIVRTKKVEGDGSLAEHHDFQEIQVKSLSTGGLFAAFKCDPLPNYWFVFYVNGINVFGQMSSFDVAKSGSLNAAGTKKVGKCSISLAG